VLCMVRHWPVGLDSSIYQAAARAVLSGDSIYQRPLPGLAGGAMDLPFIYPPIAAMLFVPLAPLPSELAWAVLGIVSVLGLGALLRTIVGTHRLTLPGNRRIPLLSLVFLTALLLEPAWRTVGLGQVNILLMLAVAADVLLLRGRRFAGVLTGLAGAVKLTPLIFVLHLLVVGRRADAARAAGTFAVLTALGALVLPSASAGFWASTLAGDLMRQAWAWVGNQSITGALQRLSGAADWVPVVATALGIAVLCLTGLLVRALHRRGEDCAAMLVTGGCATLVSPIAWSHHWVWVLPLLGLLAARATRPRAWLPVLALAVVYSGWTLVVVPSGGVRELHWNFWQSLIGDAYVIAGLLAILLVAYRVLLRPLWTTQHATPE
jgi:alpha-1,2-mannosyltransferase